ncbi:hypothetical protein CHCC14819_0450 [Bacillus licheniformis]|uniref:phage holin n=1 Tax=Bacillus licheniformis TaxID=1402 RepID=UPI00138423FA|nr:phage holin [Bacillus licheniformis]TWM32254.1 hypothetical protein CHCC14819_0450 [Bacillus licheniformis]
MNMQTLMTRLKNAKVLVAISSGILMILVNMGVIDLDMSYKMNTMVNSVLTVLIGMGIIADPESHVKNIGTDEAAEETE